MQNWKDVLNKVKTKADFINFIELLITDFKNNPDDWNNKNLESYLGAISSWVDDMEGYYINNRLDVPENIDWSFFANILIAAKMYE